MRNLSPFLLITRWSSNPYLEVSRLTFTTYRKAAEIGFAWRNLSIPFGRYEEATGKPYGSNVPKKWKILAKIANPMAVPSISTTSSTPTTSSRPGHLTGCDLAAALPVGQAAQLNGGGCATATAENVFGETLGPWSASENRSHLSEHEMFRL